MQSEKTTTAPLLISDVAALRDKLRGGVGSVQRKWDHFRRMAAHQSGPMAGYNALIALVDEDLDAARRFYVGFDRWRDFWLRRLGTHHLQSHTWCATAPLARWCIYWDWLVDMLELPEEERIATADLLIDGVYHHAYQVLQAREPSGDNQFASMLLGCAVVGYTFGIKRGSDPRAQRLWRYAMQRAGEIPEYAMEGFVGEGSTYIQRINVPVTAWWWAMMRWAGQPCDEQKLLSCQRTAWRLITPGGRVLPWDHHGHERALAMMGLALHARVTGEHEPLALMDHLGLWYEQDEAAWGHDARLWTLVFWPDDAPAEPAQRFDLDRALPGWSAARIGGALTSASRGLYLFQAWDPCAGQSITGVGRAQMDPNALHIEVGGTPMLIDGKPTANCNAFCYRVDRVLRPEEREPIERFLHLQREVSQSEVSIEQIIAKAAPGLLGSSNALVINDRPEQRPRGEVTGKRTLDARLPGMQAIAADCTEHYAPDLPVQKAERCTMLLRDRYWLVIEEVNANGDEPLRVQWQVYTRPDVRTTDQAAWVHAPEGPVLGILPDTPRTMRSEPIEGFPDRLEAKCSRVSWSARGTQLRMATAMWPADETACGTADIWQGGWLDETPGSETPALGEPVARGSLDTVNTALAEAPADQWRWLRLEQSPPDHATHLRLDVPNAGSIVWCNGQRVDRSAERVNSEHLVGLRLPVTAGRCDVLIATRSTHGRLLVRGGLWTAPAQHERPKFARVREGVEHWRLKSEAFSDDLMTRDVARTLGMTTDARWLVCGSDQQLWALDATHLDGEGVTPFKSSHRVHAHWDGASWHTQPATQDDTDTQCAESDASAAIEMPPPLPIASPEAPGYRVAETLTLDESQPLIDRLADPDWRVRVAAAQRIGETTKREAAAALRNALAKELDRTLYPPMREIAATGTLAERLSNIGREQVVNRWRVAHSMLLALAKLRDDEAVALAWRTLDDPSQFYPLHHAAIELVGALGSERDISALQKWCNAAEANCARAATRLSTGSIQ